MKMDKKKDRLLVLGGLAQVCDIVERAKQDGIIVAVTDNVPNSPAKRIADQSYSVSVTDVDGIVELCRREGISAVMNYCVDPAQKPYQQICERLDIPCYGTKSQFEILTNKDHFKRTCEENGVDIVPAFSCASSVAIKDSGLDYPVMIKPVDGRASKGISVCFDDDDVDSAVKRAKGFSESGRVICEKYMERPEVAVKYFVSNGEIALTSMSDIHTHFEKRYERNYIWSQTFPSRYYPLFRSTTDEKVRTMIRRMGIRNGPLSFSGFVDDEKFRFIDPSFRMGGAQDWRIVAAIGGINIADLMTHFAVTGTMPNTNDFRCLDGAFSSRYSMMLYFLGRKGRIDRINGLDNCATLENVIGYHVSHPEGSAIRNTGTADQVVMRFLLVADTKEELIATVQQIQAKIEVLSENGESILLPNFDVGLI